MINEFESSNEVDNLDKYSLPKLTSIEETEKVIKELTCKKSKRPTKFHMGILPKLQRPINYSRIQKKKNVTILFVKQVSH